MFLAQFVGNMDHNFADVMELVWVFLTLGISLAILVGVGRWWQK